jgi:Protein of unknown function with PCYCGC motif
MRFDFFSHRRVAAVASCVALAACAHRDAPVARPDSTATAGAPIAPAALAVADASAPNRVLDASQFADPKTAAAYAAAKSHAAVLEQVYCYCHCHENIGHRALVECFESDHGAGCDICQTEATVAARMADEGHSAAEIQKAIDAYYES